MGYTHYWTFKTPKRGETAKVERAYQRAILDIGTIARAYNSGATGDGRLSGYTAHAKAGLYGGVKLNGKEDNAHEDFTLREHYKQNLEHSFNFCKTARKPYDIVIVAALAVLKYRLKDYIIVDSDGNYSDWAFGVEYAKLTLGLNITNPRPTELDEYRAKAKRK